MAQTGLMRKKTNGNGQGWSVWTWLGILALGAIGGILGFMLRAWWTSQPFDRSTLGDPVAIANTYIVFTTFIVAVAAIIITAVGIAISGQIHRSRVSQANEAFEYLKERLENDEVQAIGMVDALLENVEVKRYLKQKLSEEVDRQIADATENAQAEAHAKIGEADSAVRRARAAHELSSRLRRQPPQDNDQ